MRRGEFLQLSRETKRRYFMEKSILKEKFNPKDFEDELYETGKFDGLKSFYNLSK